MRFTAILTGFALLPAALAAQTVSKTEFASEALGRDLPYVVYLPNGYESGDYDYPVLYLLHGANGHEQQWVAQGHVVPTLNELIAEGDVPPMIVIMPGGANNWWADGNDESMQTAFFSMI